MTIFSDSLCISAPQFLVYLAKSVYYKTIGGEFIGNDIAGDLQKLLEIYRFILGNCRPFA
jgi:hypothetical protein